MSGTTARVSVTITTHNRREDLRQTLEALAALDPKPLEVLVCADGCSDGTVEMVASEFPACSLMIHEKGVGSVGTRDELIRAARAELVLSLDDDSYPVETDFLARVAELFATRRRLGVVTFPQRTNEYVDSLGQADFGPSRYVASYVSSGAVLRRSAYLSLPGYCPEFFHAYEEPDYALQCFAAGWQTLLFTGLTVRHRYSSQARSERRTHLHHARNEAWSTVMRCPLPWAVPVGLFHAAGQFVYACKRGAGWVCREPRWWVSFFRGLPGILRRRRPVAWPLYKGWRRLMAVPVMTDDEWEQLRGDAPWQ